MDSNRPRRFCLISHPRSASNLLVRILSLESQPNVLPRKLGGYFFVPVTGLTSELGIWGKHIDRWTDEEKTRLRQGYQDCFGELEEHVETAEAEDKIIFVKEHGLLLADPTFQARFMFGQDAVQERPWMVRIPDRYGVERTRSPLNETVLPDEYLQSWCPIFLIRHPALAFPSRYRAFLDLEDATSTPEGREAHLSLNLTFHWTRSLYGWYSQYFRESGTSSDAAGVTWPILLDADDLIREPGLSVRLAQIMGMDPERLRFSWSPLSREELDGFVPNARRMLSTLFASGGIEPGKAAVDLDLDTEAKQWRDEFGETDGKMIEAYVRAAMPDYDFLKAKRLRPELN